VELAFHITQGAYLALLLTAAAWDIGKRRIPNRLTAAVLLAGLLSAWCAGGLTSVATGLAAGALTIAIGYLPWSKGGIGGGDIKLGAAAAVALGIRVLPEYLLATMIAGAAISAVCYCLSSRVARQEMALNLRMASVGVMPSPSIRGGHGRISVPYGAAFVLAALWVVLVHRAY
jgi:prepilin peptidase CpaA